MSSFLVMRAIVTATALSVIPAVASAQAPQTKPCKDGTSSTRSTFACWGHGGVDTTHAERAHAATAKHHEAQAVQAGEPRAKHTKSTTHKAAKSTIHHAKAEHRDSHAVTKKKQDETHRGWLPWRHKNTKEHDAKAKKQDAKKTKKHKSSSRPPITERPNGQPGQN